MQTYVRAYRQMTGGIDPLCVRHDQSKEEDISASLLTRELAANAPDDVKLLYVTSDVCVVYKPPGMRVVAGKPEEHNNA